MAETETQQRLADDPQMPTAGTVVGQRYEIQEVLGEGGFAVVYAAYDARTKAKVAVKVLDPIMSRRNEFASRFMREVETVSRLRHHNSITIFDAGETDNGCLYLVMELLEGRPLDVVLEEEGSLSPDRVRKVAIQILKSLQEAHSKGIIHRDLKPANVFLADLAGESDYVKVLDFGIAKSLDDSQDTSLTATGQVMCSPHYVAPERIKDHLTVPASDLYSLGVMMVELLEGKPPYEADSPMMLAVKHLSAEPVPLGDGTLRAPFARIVKRACAKGLDERYDSALEMIEDLIKSETAALPASNTNVGAEARGGAATERMPAHRAASTTGTLVDEFAPPRSQRGLMVGVILLFVLLGGVAAKFIISTPPDPPPADNVAAVEVPAEVEPVIEPEPPEAVEPVILVDVPGTMRTASNAVANACQIGSLGAIAANAGEPEEQVAAATPTENSRDRDRDRDRERERDRQAAEDQAAEDAVAAAAAEERAEEERREAAEAEAQAAREAQEAADREAAENAAEEEEERGGRRNIRTNVAPRQ